MNEFQTTYGESYARINHPDAPQCHLQVIGFPCNQFGLQEPAHNDELLNGLKYVRPGNGFVPKFPLSKKIEVNGDEEHDVFTFLKSRCPAPGGIVWKHHKYSHLLWTPVRPNDINWNFQKWLIHSNGQPYRRYSSDTIPEMMETDILSLINECVLKQRVKNSKVKRTVDDVLRYTKEH